MNLKKLFFAPFVALGFIACSSDDIADEGKDPSTNANTYVNFSINFASSANTKALPEDYNPDGTYEGTDLVKTLDLYIVSADGTLEAKRLNRGDLSFTSSVLTPNEPFRTTSGSKSIYVVFNSPNPIGTKVPTDNDLIDIAGLAQVGSDEKGQYDVVMMTGKNLTVSIAPDVSQQAAISGANNFSVVVTRLASRAIVTTTASTDLLGTNGVKIGTISNITYSVAQGTKKVYFTGKSDYTTYGSSYVTALGDYITQAPTYYDYADLSTPSAVPAQPTNGDYKSLAGKFLFENTHTIGDVKTSGYKKGNTAYVLVKAVLTPDPASIADGGTLTNNTFYVGASDGKIYSSKAAAQAAVTNQKVSLYQNGKMIYYAWLNPDNINKPLNSPVLRNNIYHVNITGFGKLGLNWNPLYPEDPDTTNPGNPDPKPTNPDEPNPPIDPTDPLTPEETYMSVDITLLNWTVHSYDIEL
ncbi:MAG: Mfa1 family fimbria major subunit [Prevotella sp.]|nr:Mfa1 family fimbria major subunit [Prevotella sp.]